MFLKLWRFWSKPDCFFLAVCFLMITTIGNAQIYHHNFGNSTINSHPYLIAPTTFNTNLSNSSWTNSIGNWTSNNGASGEAIRLTTASVATITLTFTVAPNFEASITSFDFWRQRSNFGPQNWSMTINGIPVGNGITPTSGAATGNLNVTNAVSGLTGTVTIIISLTGNTNNGNFLIDDFKLFGTVVSNCASATITSVFPTSGPQNTLVTIEGSGFASGTTAVKFNNINANGFTVVSDTKITAYLPAGNTSGNVSVTTNGCEGFAANPFTAIKTVTAGNFSSNIYISELYDAQAGDGGVIELYNGTASTVNLSGYSIRRYGDIGGSTFYTINLTGSIPPGGIFLIGIGTGTIPCSWTPSQGQAYSTGFNANDEFELYHNGNVIDNVHTPGNVGYSMIRNANAVAPKVTFNSNDWNNNSSNTESCANIGVHTVTNVTPPTVTAPSSRSTCEDGSVVFSSPMSNPGGYVFQWKMLNTAGIWVNVPNAIPYSNANTNTLTINPVPAGFDESQFYCQMTSGGTILISPAAQLEVTAKKIPDFMAVWNICANDVISIGNTSPNGISGTWSAAFSNTSSGTYTFTPNAGQCAQNQTITINVSNRTPDFQSVWNICANDVISIGNTSPNGISGTWSAAFSNTTSGTYTFTPTAGQCAQNQTITINVSNRTPDFQSVWNICANDVISIGNTSPNGISGTWSAAFSNTTSGTYTFTPNAGQCAQNQTITINVSNRTPDFQSVWNICANDVISIGNTSPNGISGTWSAAFSNTTSGTYTFTPTAGQCAQIQTITINVSNKTPNFQSVWNICANDVISIGNTSPNGISGTWSAAFSNTISGNYTFTPNAGQCAQNQTIIINVSNRTPNFQSVWNICANDVISIGNTSPNGISGSWSSVFSNTTSGTYTFTPTAGQCAQNQTITINVSNRTPDFQLVWNICANDVISIGNTSPNGISGSWSAAFSSTTSGTYTFTPNAGQCAQNQTITILIISQPTSPISGNQNVCVGKTIVLSNSIAGGIWESDNTAVATVDQLGNVYGIAIGFANISYIFRNGNCLFSVSKLVSVSPIPNPILHDASICVDHTSGKVLNPAVLNSGLSGADLEFIWTWNGNLLPTITGEHTATVSGFYEVLVTNKLTGCQSTASCNVRELAMPTATATVSEDFSLNSTVSIEVSHGSGSYEYRLNDNPYQNSPVFYDVPSGENTIVINDLAGCQPIYLSVYVLNYPRFFTPNNDGYNDSWNISGLPNHSNSIIYIFDRYGKLIKSLRPSDSTGWDGTFNGNPLPASDYWFQLNYYNKQNEKREFSSHFSLKR